MGIDKADVLFNVCRRVLSREDDRNYAYHRWINSSISHYCENLFCKYGAQKVENKKDKEKDFFINGVPFDLKVTNYPMTAYEHFDLSNDIGKKDLILWYYKNQAVDRKHLKNKIYIVCMGSTEEEKWQNRINLELIENKIKEFMKDINFLKIDKYNVVSNIVVVG